MEINNKLNIVYKSVDELIPYVNNPRDNKDAIDKVASSIKNFGFKVPLVIDNNNEVITGHTRLLASKKLGIKEVPVIIADDLSEAQVKAFRIADNKVSEYAEWDEDLLKIELEELVDLDFDLMDTGFEATDFKDLNIAGFADVLSKDVDEGGKKGALEEKFLVPPFTVLDTRQGYWNNRKRLWREKIKDNAEARENAKVYTIDEKYKKDFNDVSLLDPVLSELMVSWFSPLEEYGTNCFDCFAGDTVFGFVSSYMGKNFTGIELREEQAEFNQQRCDEFNLSAKYICDDGRNVLKHLGEGTQDLLFSCPPYFDLEVYSDKENDASNQATYEEFYAILDTAFKESIKCLKDDRFAVIVVGDIRDKKTGGYYGFMDSVKQTFKEAGMILYNEMILVNSVGTGAMRASRMMQNRKVCKVHQNVLVFYKGKQENIKKYFKEVEIPELESDLDESENE